MLERATACVEPAGHLLKRFETPLRSNRLLLQSFWKHGGYDIAGPAWWPEYLQDVRCSSQARLQVERNVLRGIGSSTLSSSERTGQHLNTILSHNSVQSARCAVELQSRFDGSRQDRSYFQSFRRFQEHILQPKIVYREERSGRSKGPLRSLQLSPYNTSNPDEHGPLESAIRSPPIPIATSCTGSSQYQITQSPDSRHVYAKPEELIFLLQERQDAFDEAWRLFISLQTQRRFARRMLQYLSKSKRRIDHERALRAYKMLSVDQKTEQTYANAMRVANSRKSQRLALEINREALSRSLGSESSRIFFGYLARNNLWNTLALALDDVRGIRNRFVPDSANEEKKDAQNSDRQSEQEDKLWNRVWADIDKMVQLPEKVLSLMHRISIASSASPLKGPKVERLARHLLYRVVQSPRIMAVITGNGFLSLFQKCAKIDLLSPNHYHQAVRTLLTMAKSRNRSQLAALAYRNLRFRFPAIKIPRWIYGSLISIFTEAAQPSHSLRFLLDEFASMHGSPDPKAYQKVMVASARHGDVDGVYEVFRQFSDTHGLPEDLGYVTPLLYVHARLGDVASTQAQFDRLTSEFNLLPDTYCWNILLASHARARDSVGAFSIFRDMQRVGVKPDAYSFGTLMSISANNGDTEAVYKLVDLARNENVPGSNAMVDTLVHAYCLNDDPESAQDLVEAATNMNLEGSPTRMWNILLRHYAFQANSNAVLRVQERMREMSVKPDEMTYAALMTALVVIGKTKDAARILRSLHFNQHLTATLFHYSIVLHGFSMERNRDMVSVIYNEILERFPRPSVSARLAVLHSQTRRDVSAWRARQMRISPASGKVHLPQALNFLADTLLRTNQTDLATKDPQPGFQRRSPAEALPSIYMEFLIKTLNSAGAFHEAEKLLARCQSLIDTSYLRDIEKTNSSIQLLTAHMIGCIKRKEFTRVEECWNLIFQQAVSRGQQLVRNSDSFEEDFLASSSPPRPSSAVDVSLPTTSKDFGSTTSFTSSSEGYGLRVLPSQRYLLAAPITHYMQALSSQNLVGLVPGLVEKLERSGFALTSKNYNTYVQVMAQSTDPQHQLQAFKFFEEKFLPNLPPWPILRRGKWVPRSAPDKKLQDKGWGEESESESNQDSEPEPVPRKFIEKFRLGQLVPTYYTMVFLGIALTRFQRRSARGEEMNLRHLRVHAPGTLNAVTQLPYLRDRVQGILLRGREVKGDLVKRPRRPPKPDRAGLRGSKSPLDHIPIDHAYSNTLPSMELGSQHSKGSDSTLSSLWDAQIYTGEVLREPAVMERTGQPELNREFRKRLRREQLEKSAVVKQMRADAKAGCVVSDTYFGEPHIESTNFRTKDTTFRRQLIQQSAVASQKEAVIRHEARGSSKRVWETRRDGHGSYPALPPAHLQTGKNRYPKRQRLALVRSRILPEVVRGLRSTDPTQLTIFKPPIPPTHRQSKAFSLNKRARRRRKIFRQHETSAQNRIQTLARIKVEGRQVNRRRI